jgi:hypothetical protein
MTRNPNHVTVVTAADIENMRRTNGPQAVDARDIISGKVDGRPTFHCGHTESDPRWLGSQVACTFTAPLGSKEQLKHVDSHRRKLSAAEKKQAENFEARRRAIYVTSVECGCGRIMKPGDPPHACNGVRETGPMSIDVGANEFLKAGLRRALAELNADDKE